MCVSVCDLKEQVAAEHGICYSNIWRSCWGERKGRWDEGGNTKKSE